jgi:hypothetical protein
LTTILSAIRDYLKDYTGLSDSSPIWVDYIGASPTEYSVVPLAGERIIETYLTGATLREYPFAFRSVESTAADLERMENNGFYEEFASWLEEQSELGNLPNLEEGKTAELIEALGWGYLYEEGNSETGIYQIQCRLVYEQD